MLRLGKLLRASWTQGQTVPSSPEALKVVRMSQVLESLQLLLPLGFDLMSCDLFRKCIYASMRILFWSLVLLLLIQCSAGMTISYMLNDYMVDPSRSALETG